MSRSRRDKQAALVELNYRFALPVASLVLALVGLPLGLYTVKGGKAAGLVLAILLVFGYYILMALGLSLSKQGRLHPVWGLWLANSVFGVVGLTMLTNMRRVRMGWQLLQRQLEELVQRFVHRRSRKRQQDPAAAKRRTLGEGFFQILDIYILRGWLFYFLISLVTFTGIYMIFDFFQVLGDIVRNHVGARLVFDYYHYLLPQAVYLMLPLSILVATLVNFSLLTKTNQVTAFKSVGISLYRISLPVLLAAAILSGGCSFWATAICRKRIRGMTRCEARLREGRPRLTIGLIASGFSASRTGFTTTSSLIPTATSSRSFRSSRST